MKNIFYAIIAISLSAMSCKTAGSVIFSTTYIEPNKSFILGGNEHKAYTVTVKNISDDEVTLFQWQNNGANQLPRVLNAKKSIIVNIDKNTALYITNKSDKKATVSLSFTSNINLSMGYKN